jgi:spermidine synthase
MAKKSLAHKLLLYSLVFFSGFASLATEIIGPRLVASLFGSTTVIWAIIISVTLVGISVGYFLGGRVPQKRVMAFFPVILILDAVWLVALSWFIWKIPAGATSAGYFSIGVIAILSFFPPAVLFSMTSPLVISLVSMDYPPETISREVGNIYGIGTLGSVVGALAAAFILIPWVGLSTSLKIFALGAVLYAIVLMRPRQRLLGVVFVPLILFFPLPVYHGIEDFSSVLLAQKEGYYQTIRVYSDNSTYIRMDLGPTFHAKMRLSDKEPEYGYAVEMIHLAGDVRGKEILIIGGAGHTQARALEKRGASITEVEIDPFVIQMSDQYFGEIKGEVISTDGRAYLEKLKDRQYDFIFVDAFDGLASVPPQLITQEFFEAVNRALKPGGRLIYNFIGVPSGPHSNSFRAVTTTMGTVFADVRSSRLGESHLVNLVLIASNTRMADISYPEAPEDGVLLTDDLNPAEIFFEQARSQN